jgi:tripartite-type tricarboxylate transporter receptor subunit TctC
MAGTGGGADRYARIMTGINLKKHYIPQDLLPVNRTGGAGAVAMDYVKKQKGSDYTILISLNSFVTTPLFQGLDMKPRDFGDVAILALDNFVLWVNVNEDWQTYEEFLASAREESIEVCGTGTKQEDETVFAALAMLEGLKPFKYVPYPGGGDVAKALAGHHHRADVNQVSEALPYFPDYFRPLVVFQDFPLEVEGLEDVPLAKDLGTDLSYYQIRAIMASPGRSEAAHKGQVEFFSKINEDPDWQDYLKEVGIQRVFITGDDLWDFWDEQWTLHENVFTELGWID